MQRFLIGVLVVPLVLPALAAYDDAKPPLDQVKAVVTEYETARAAYLKTAQAAKTVEERKEATKKLPNVQEYGKRLLTLAEKHPKTEAALEAYSWVLTNAGASSALMVALPVNGKPREDQRGPALTALKRDFITSDRLGAVCSSLRSSDDATLEFLREVIDKNPHKNVKGVATLSLASTLGSQASSAQRYRDLVKRNPEQFERLKNSASVKAALALDADKLAAESTRLYKDAADKYLEALPKEDLVRQCQNLARTTSSGALAFLRAVLENSKHREAQGFACLTLANALKDRSDSLARAGKKGEAEASTRAAVQMFERVLEDYADLKDARGRSLGETVKPTLFEIDALSIGKVVPEVEAEDIDGKSFKLSDYRGKVVLLDFWGHW